MQFTAQNPFIYQQPTGSFDWRLFASTDVEGAIATQNVQAMLPLVDNLAFGELDAPVGLQKVFRAQQFMLQYLIYVQTELSNQLYGNSNQNDLEAEIRRLKAENQRLSKELREEKQKRASDNMMMRLASLKPELVEAMPRCLECGKAFADYRFLVTHYQKRHPGKRIPPPPIPNYKIEKPEYVLCNCKVAPQPAAPKPSDSPKNTSDIFIENEQLNTIIGEKKVRDSLSQTGTFNMSAQSPRIQEETGVLKPEQANFSLNSTFGTTFPLSTGPGQAQNGMRPSQNQSVKGSQNTYQVPEQNYSTAPHQSSQIVLDPEAAMNSYTNSSGGKETFQCFYAHSKYEQNQAEQNIWNLIGGK